MPYIPKLSDEIKRIIKPINLTPAYTTCNMEKIFNKIKDPTPHNKKTHIVYEIPCSDHNCEKIYIGNTKQYLNARLNGHKYSENATALKKHIHETSHTFDFNKTKILTHEKYETKRNILEMLHIIAKRDVCVNDRNDYNGVDAIYKDIIDKLKTKKNQKMNPNI